MDKFRVLEIKKSIFEDNDHEADLLREDLKKEKNIPFKPDVLTGVR